MDRIIGTALSFDDVLLIPSYSELNLADIDISTNIFGRQFQLPVFSAAMDTITGLKMAEAMWVSGGAGVFHKNQTADEQRKLMKEMMELKATTFGFAVSIGDYSCIEKGLSISPTSFAVVDTAHADTKDMNNFVKELVKRNGMEEYRAGNFDMNRIVIGNIATADAAKRLIDNGAKVLKIGHGNGSICSTRIVAGTGIPQLKAIMDISDAISSTPDVRLIADGGLRSSGDIVKALAAGAHAVMLGGMLAGTIESIGGENYRGMGSLPAMAKGSASRYGQTQTQKHTPEGVEVTVHKKGSVYEVLQAIEGGIRSGMGYTGSKNLAELREALFIRITDSGLRESHPHSYKELKNTINYNIRGGL